MATEASETKAAKSQPKKADGTPKKASAKKAAAPKKASKKTPKKGSSKPAFGAKSDFVRSMPREMPAKDVVEAAQKKGLTLTDNLVYAVRASSKKASAKGAKGSGGKKASLAAPKAKAGKESKPAPASSLESDLRRCVAELGLARARAIFGEVEQAFSGA